MPLRFGTLTRMKGPCLEVSVDQTIKANKLNQVNINKLVGCFASMAKGLNLVYQATTPANSHSRTFGF